MDVRNERRTRLCERQFLELATAPPPLDSEEERLRQVRSEREDSQGGILAQRLSYLPDIEEENENVEIAQPESRMRAFTRAGDSRALASSVKHMATPIHDGARAGLLPERASAALRDKSLVPLIHVALDIKEEVLLVGVSAEVHHVHGTHYSVAPLIAGHDQVPCS